MKKTVAMIVATALVALTPMFAYADAGPKSQVSIDDAKLLTEVQTLMDKASAGSFTEDNHGGIVSWANHNFQTLLSSLGISGEQPTRGQIISAIAKSDAGKSNEGKADADVTGTPTATATVGAAAATEKGNKGKGKSNEDKNKGNGDDEEDVTTSAATTATATTVPTATATPEATSTTPVPTSEERGHRGNPNR